MTADPIRVMMRSDLARTEDIMLYNFQDPIVEEATVNVTELVKSILDLEDAGDINEDDTDECIYYLRKISAITGLEIDFDIFQNEE